MTNHDLAALEVMLRSRGDVVILSDKPNESRTSLLPLKTMVVPEADIGKVSLLCFLVHAAPLPHVAIRPLSDLKVAIDTEKSHVIDFVRAFHRDNMIRAGRTFYTPKYFEDGAFHDKDPAFVSWAEGVTKAIRRALTFDKKRGSYMGSDAARLIEAGELKVIS